VHRVTRRGNLIGPLFLQDCRAGLGAVMAYAETGHKVTQRVSEIVRRLSQSALDGHIHGTLTADVAPVFGLRRHLQVAIDILATPVASTSCLMAMPHQALPQTPADS